MTIDEAVAACFFGKATAVKRGRDTRWPYIAVIDHTRGDIVMRQRTESLRLAYASREEATAKAQQLIDARRERLRADLAKPNMRALRKYHGIE